MAIWDVQGSRPRGYLSPAYTYIKNKLGSGLVGAEIGISMGYGTEYVVDGMDFKLFYMVDPYVPYDFNETTQEAFNDQYAKATEKFCVYPYVRFLRMSSEDASKLVPDGSLDFVFIDANHFYPAVKKDLDLWYPKVRPGGVFSGHDYFINPPEKDIDKFIYTWAVKGIHYGVIKAVNEFVITNNVKLQCEDLDWWIDK
jgi:hypothetical protein